MSEQPSESAPALLPEGEADTRSEARARDPLSRAEAGFARELFERHQLSLYRYLIGLLHSREEAKEVLQETYLRLIRQPNFDRLRDNARAYLFATATNLARDLFRLRASRGMEVEADLRSATGLDSPQWDSWPDLALEAEQVGLAIARALETLEPNVRAALLLHRFRDMTYEAIGTELGVSQRTVKRYVREGLSVIAAQLREGR